jgi:hypothetical protein
MPSYLLTPPAAEPVTLAQAKVAARVDDSAFDAIITAARAEIAWIDFAQCHETTAVRCRSPFWPAWPSWGGWRADEFSECASPF